MNGAMQSDFSTTDLFDQVQLETFGIALAGILRKSDCLLLYGDLGAGKTTLARAIIQAATGESDVPSPTFTLVQTYHAPAFELWHYDLYRLKREEELKELALDEAFSRGVCLMEWPEIAAEMLPVERLDITLSHVDDPHRRRINLKGTPEWHTRLQSLPGFR